MREEVQNALLGCTFPSLRMPGNQNQASVTSHFQLHFNNELPEIIFTGNIVEPKGNTPVQVFLTDTDKRTITSGPLSTLKIEFLVLGGDFGDEEQRNWTEEEFNKFVLIERTGKGPLLKGNRFITLKDGVGNLPSISFTDNSKWTRTQKFRLGARVFQNNLVEERIQEAISEAFSVNDHRGEYNMKHDIPLLEDEVWRLKIIRKDGTYHRKLEDLGIKTVRDFLKLLVMDQDQLCRILFDKKGTNKRWTTIVQHAWKCDLGHKLYSYIVPEEQALLVFNSVLQVIGAGFRDHAWKLLSQLSESQQDLVSRLKRIAYRNQNAIVEMNDPTNSHLLFPSAQLATCIPESYPSNICCSGVQTSHEGPWNSSVPVRIEDSKQACFSMGGCQIDGVFHGEPCPTTNSCSMDGVFDRNNGFYRIESCGDLIPRQNIPRRKWVKLKVTAKLWASIRKHMSARSSARVQQAKWFRLITALKFGLWCKTLAAARREAGRNMYQSPIRIDQVANSLWPPTSPTSYIDYSIWDDPY
uniref:Clathrin heavy chain n=1 Tax=Anthurium amnicola TaxID=1678845 RepID=A0A1D1YBU0_9ARAE